VCGVWCVVCGVWCVVCGVWCVVCGVWCVVCGVWCVVCGVWCVVCGGSGNNGQKGLLPRVLPVTSQAIDRGMPFGLLSNDNCFLDDGRYCFVATPATALFVTKCSYSLL